MLSSKIILNIPLDDLWRRFFKKVFTFVKRLKNIEYICYELKFMTNHFQYCQHFVFGWVRKFYFFCLMVFIFIFNVMWFNLKWHHLLDILLNKFLQSTIKKSLNETSFIMPALMQPAPTFYNLQYMNFFHSNFF